MRLLLALERDFTPRFAREIVRAMQEMVRFYRLTGEVPPTPTEHIERLMRIETALVQVSVDAFGSRVIDQGKCLGIILETKTFTETLRRIAEEYVKQEMIRQRITNIAATTRQQIVEIVLRGQEDGVSVSDIADMILEAAPNIALWRGPLIARTETHGAANAGAYRAAQETGLQLRKEWISVIDDRTRDPHLAANGQVVDQNEPFIVNDEPLMFPGDPSGSADNIINCRCAMGHIVVDG